MATDSNHTAIPENSSRLRPEAFLLAMIIAIVLCNQVWGEKLAYADGLGWDGQIYASIVRDLRSNFFEKGLDRYYVQRFLPPAVVGLSLASCGLDPTNENIISGFAILNTLCMLLSLWTWKEIAGELRLGSTGRCLTLLAIFVNCFFLKISPYYPVLTDCTALLIGLLQFVFYLRNRTLLLLITSAVGAFAWPTTLPIGVLLALFPPEAAREPVTSRSSVRVAWGLASFISSLFLAILAYDFYRWYIKGRTWSVYGGGQPLAGLLPLTAVLAVCLILAALIPLLSDQRLYSIHALLHSTNRRNLVLVVLVFSLVKLVQRWLLSRDAVEGISLPGQFSIIVRMAGLKPGISLLGQLVYWGPVFALLVLYWPTVALSLRRMGIGMILVGVAGGLLAIDPEARHLVNIYPMVALAGIRAIEPGIPRRLLLVLAPLSFFASLFWFRINTGPFKDDPLAFPDQNYFMTQGPWLGTTAYVVLLGYAMALAIVLFRVCFRHRIFPSGRLSTSPAE